MKKIVAIIGMVVSLSLGGTGITNFDSATTTGDSFKGLFWLVIGVISFLAFVDDFKKNKWPI